MLVLVAEPLVTGDGMQLLGGAFPSQLALVGHRSCDCRTPTAHAPQGCVLYGTHFRKHWWEGNRRGGPRPPPLLLQFGPSAPPKGQCVGDTVPSLELWAGVKLRRGA